MPVSPSEDTLRIVLTGGPGGQDFVPHGPSFLAKITTGLHTLTEILAGARNHNGRLDAP